MDTATAIIGSGGDQRAKNAYHSQAVGSVGPGNAERTFGFPDSIPAGKRLVIEMVAVRMSMPKGQGAILDLVTVLGQEELRMPLAVSQGPSFPNKANFISEATYGVRLYADSVWLSVNRLHLEGDLHVHVDVVGYLEKL